MVVVHGTRMVTRDVDAHRRLDAPRGAERRPGTAGTARCVGSPHASGRLRSRILAGVMTSRRFGILLLSIVLLAAALRFWGLGRDGLWTDEATTVLLAERPLPELMKALRADVQAPLHYLLVKPMLAFLGDADVVPRLLSAFAGVLAVALCALVGRSRLGDRGALLAALLLATSPIHVAYSREARAYALLALLTLLAYAAVDAVRAAPSLGRALLAAPLVASLPLTHGLGAVHGAFVAVAAGLPDLRDRASWRRTLPMLLLAGVLAVALAAPWLLSATGQGGAVSVAYSWARRAWDESFPWQVPLSLMALSPGAAAPVRSLWPGPSAAGIAGAVLAAGLVLSAVASRRRLPDASAPLRLLAAAVLPLGAIFAVSCLLAPLHVVGRVESPLAPLFALLLGAGLASLPPRAAVVATVMAVLLSVPALRETLTVDVRSDERELAHFVASKAGPRDAVVVLGAYRFALEHYIPQERPGVSVTSFPQERDAHPSWVDWSRHDDASLRLEATQLAARLQAELRARGGGDVWLVSIPEPGTRALQEALDAALVRAGAWRTPLPGLEVARFRLPEAPAEPAASP